MSEYSILGDEIRYLNKNVAHYVSGITMLLDWSMKHRTINILCVLDAYVRVDPYACQLLGISL